MDAPRPLVWSIGALLLAAGILIAALVPGVGMIPPVVTALSGIAILGGAFVEASLRRPSGTLLIEQDVTPAEYRIVEALHPGAGAKRGARPSRAGTQPAALAEASAQPETGPEVAVPLRRTPIAEVERQVDQVIRSSGVHPRAPRKPAKRPKKTAQRRRSHGRRTEGRRTESRVVVARRSR